MTHTCADPKNHQFWQFRSQYFRKYVTHRIGQAKFGTIMYAIHTHLGSYDFLHRVTDAY